MPRLKDAPQEFASGLDSELMKLTQELQTISNKNINNLNQNFTKIKNDTISSSNITTDTDKTFNDYTNTTKDYANQSTNSNFNINWNDVVKKEARGLDGADSESPRG